MIVTWGFSYASIGGSIWRQCRACWFHSHLQLSAGRNDSEVCGSLYLIERLFEGLGFTSARSVGVRTGRAPGISNESLEFVDKGLLSWIFGRALATANAVSDHSYIAN